MKELFEKNISMVIAITGGGTEAIGELLRHGGASKVIHEINVPYGKAAGIKYVGMAPEKYCSRNYALNLAMESYRRAKAYTTGNEGIVGVGATAKLYQEGERPGRNHGIWVAVQTDWETYTCQLEFMPVARIREMEEHICKQFIINCILQSQDLPVSHYIYDNLLVNGECTVPCVQRASKELHDTFHNKYLATWYTNKVANPLIFPGSFDPIHEGHINICRAAYDYFDKNRYIVLEICIHNTDKPSLDYMRLQERVETIRRKLKNEDWFGGIVITGTPLFIEKIDALNQKDFIVGRDTFDRIFSRDYIGQYSQQNFIDKNVHFYVFDRKVAELSCDHVDKSLYTMIPESIYCDTGISSSKIRKTAHVH